MSSPVTELPAKKKHTPYVPETMQMKEFTLRALLIARFPRYRALSRTWAPREPPASIRPQPRVQSLGLAQHD